MSLVPGAKFDHVAHAGRRIRDLLPVYRDTLGGEFLFGSNHRSRGYKVVQLAYADGTKVELIEPSAGSTFLDKFFERNPRGGLHHVTFRVPNLDAAVEAATSAGLEVFDVNVSRPEWKEAFIHPRVAHGALVQLAEVQPGWPPQVPGLTIDTILDDD
jgi:methylmalonyl-CoA/ethylmalonyl-CoA epimerase